MATVRDVVLVLFMVNILLDVLGKVYLFFSLIELAFPALAIVVFGGLVLTRSWEGRLTDSFEGFELRDGLNFHRYILSSLRGKLQAVLFFASVGFHASLLTSFLV